MGTKSSAFKETEDTIPLLTFETAAAFHVVTYIHRNIAPSSIASQVVYSFRHVMAASPTTYHSVTSFLYDIAPFSTAFYVARSFQHVMAIFLNVAHIHLSGRRIFGDSSGELNVAFKKVYPLNFIVLIKLYRQWGNFVIEKDPFCCDGSSILQ